MIGFLLGLVVGGAAVLLFHDHILDTFDAAREIFISAATLVGVAAMVGVAGLAFGWWHL